MEQAAQDLKKIIALASDEGTAQRARESLKELGLS